jgi:hypothetical protein
MPNSTDAVGHGVVGLASTVVWRKSTGMRRVLIPLPPLLLHRKNRAETYTFLPTISPKTRRYQTLALLRQKASAVGVI